MNIVQTLGGHHQRNAPDDALAFQCHGTNVGPMGTIRSGNGNETGGVPFLATYTERGEGHSTYQDDDETGALRLNGGGGIHANLVAHFLRGEGFDASEDGTGRGTPLVPVAFNASDYANGAFEESECARPITTTADRTRAAPVVVGYISPRALRNSDSANEVGIKDGDIHDTLQSDGPGAIAFAQNSRDEVRELGGNIAGVLSAQPGMKQQTYVAFKESQSGVRRLMPIECERCQGIPDDWTRYGITDDGKEVELSDSARYRLVGNSVAVPCVDWIAKRIKEQHVNT